MGGPTNARDALKVPLISSEMYTQYTCYLDRSPFGKPSCCSSLSRASPLTLCFAALLKMKARAAMAALMSESSYLASAVSLLTLVYCGITVG